MAEVTAIETGLALWFLVYGPMIAAVAAVTGALWLASYVKRRRRIPVARTLCQCCDCVLGRIYGDVEQHSPRWL